MNPRDPRKQPDRILAPPASATLGSRSARPGPPPLPAAAQRQAQSASGSVARGNMRPVAGVTGGAGIPMLPLVIVAACVGLVAVTAAVFALVRGQRQPQDVAAKSVERPTGGSAGGAVPRSNEKSSASPEPQAQAVDVPNP